MNLVNYPLRAQKDFISFAFDSSGKQGLIRKVIQFQDTGEANLYNLAFGDVGADGESLDDLVVSNNGDTQQVLATVVAALYIFYEHYPDATVYATGSTPARIRFYRIGITKFYDEMQRDFYVYGQVGSAFYLFELGQLYDGFLVQRKFD